MTDDIDDTEDDEAPLPRIEQAAPLDGRRVAIKWRGGDSDVIDVTPALSSKRIFMRLRTDDDLFRTLKVNEDGNAIEWADGAELTAIWLERLPRCDGSARLQSGRHGG
jgi:hypothetical protein